jgi:small-conductance mechanosensitive channel
MMEDKIRVVDGDGSTTGRVKDLNMFTVTLETEDGKTVTLPNNLILQQPVEVSIHA